jgi:hypothetical protein
MLRIKNWDAVYENVSSRGMEKLACVAVPNRFDG